MQNVRAGSSAWDRGFLQLIEWWRRTVTSCPTAIESSRRRFWAGCITSADGLRELFRRHPRAPAFIVLRPGPDQPAHAAMLDALREIFGAHQQDERVRLDYDTELFFGPLR